MPPQRKEEIEIKLRVAYPAALRRHLRLLGARLLRRVFERNAVFDTPGGLFYHRGRLLRLRSVTPGAGKRRDRPLPGLITFKGPSKSSRPYKVREEVELNLPDAHRAETLLRAVGLVPAFRYEKWRTSFRIPALPTLHVYFDETPIGCFIELEGSPRAIDRAARLLGYHPADYLTSSYRALYLIYCRRRGIQPRHMVFPRQKK